MRLTYLSIIFLSLFSGCSLSNEKVYPQNNENIKQEDIVLYQELKDDGFDIEREREYARNKLEQTFSSINNKKEEYNDRSNTESDRFSDILKSYNKKD